MLLRHRLELPPPLNLINRELPPEYLPTHRLSAELRTVAMVAATRLLRTFCQAWLHRRCGVELPDPQYLPVFTSIYVYLPAGMLGIYLPDGHLAPRAQRHTHTDLARTASQDAHAYKCFKNPTVF